MCIFDAAKTVVEKINTLTGVSYNVKYIIVAD